ncbi:MAG: PAS domain S-box protein, partial [bacterium]|nr:PAS domain S-box protein [bacterium]
MEESQFRNILDNLYDAVYFVDRDVGITYWNQAAERLTGFSASEVTGRKCSDAVLTHVDEQGHLLCVHGCPLQATMQDGSSREAEVFLHHKNGFRVPVAVRTSAI